MLVSDLIKQLQELEVNTPEMMQPAEIMIDVFQESDYKGLFQYAGFDKDIKITYSADGVYPILTAFANTQ